MPKMKDISQIADKWARVTPGRVGEYQSGVQSPRTSWAGATAAADGAYKAGVQSAIEKGSFKRGVQQAGDAKWQSATLDKGPARFAEGVSMSSPAFMEGFAPYAAVIESTQLPPRYARGDPRNVDRVKVLAAALNKRRNGGK
jgi:hypothetical protein